MTTMKATDAPVDLAAARRWLAGVHSELRNRGKNPLEAVRVIADTLIGEGAMDAVTAPSALEPSNLSALAFQEFISDDSRGVFGQYLTPHVVAAHVADLVARDGSTGSAMDPFMGSGILLDALATNAPALKLLGFEINEDVAHVGRAALALAGHDVDVTVGDAFTAWVEGSMPAVESVVANPPFGAHVSDVDRRRLSNTITAESVGQAARLPVELLALELCMDLLTPTGKLGIVLPQSVLTNGGGWARFRSAFFGKYRLLHATSLPQETFVPFRGVAKACVLLVVKEAPNVPATFSLARSRSIGYDDTGRPEGTSDLEAVADRFFAGETPSAGFDDSGHVTTSTPNSPEKVRRLGDIAEVARGKNPARDQYVEAGSFLLKVGSLSGSFISWRDRKRSRVPAEWFDKNPKKHLRAGDICFTGTAHRPSYIGLKVDMVDQLPDEGAMPSAEVICVRLHDDSPFPPTALLYYLRSSAGYDAIQELVKGSTAHVYPRDLVELQIPDLNVMFDVGQVVDAHERAARAFREYLSLEKDAHLIAGAERDPDD